MFSGNRKVREKPPDVNYAGQRSEDEGGLRKKGLRIECTGWRDSHRDAGTGAIRHPSTV